MIRVLLLSILALSTATAIAQSETSGTGLSVFPRSTPELQGVDSATLLKFIDDVDKHVDTMNSFMLVRHGHVVAEAWWTPYDAQTPHVLYSLSKSFTSTAVGLAIAEGKMTIDDAVVQYFPDDAPAEPSANLKSMRVRDLLRMTTGHATEPPMWRDQPDSSNSWCGMDQKVSASSCRFQAGHAVRLQHSGHIYAVSHCAKWSLARPSATIWARSFSHRWASKLRTG